MSQDAQRQIGPPPSYHACYRTVLRAVDARYDVRGSVLAEMVKACLAQRAACLRRYGRIRAVRASRSDGLPGKGHGHAAVWSQGALFAARVPLLRRDRSRQVMAGLFRPHSRRLAGAAPAM